MRRFCSLQRGEPGTTAARLWDFVNPSSIDFILRRKDWWDRCVSPDLRFSYLRLPSITLLLGDRSTPQRCLEFTFFYPSRTPFLQICSSRHVNVVYLMCYSVEESQYVTTAYCVWPKTLCYSQEVSRNMLYCKQKHLRFDLFYKTRVLAKAKEIFRGIRLQDYDSRPNSYQQKLSRSSIILLSR